MKPTHDLKAEFLLDPQVTYLNFGSFGACPRPVFEEYQRLQLDLEREPVQFIAVNGATNLKRSRESLAAFVGCHAEDLVYVPNPSYAVNIIAKSMMLEEGDEILTTDLEYGACEKTWTWLCKKTGAKLVKRPARLPLTDAKIFATDFLSGITPRTRLIYISHITSNTALILPVADICEGARKKGVMTFIDGAHAPAHIPLNIDALGADIYTGACHKWMLAPKGSSFMFVKKELQSQFDPLVISWGYDPSGVEASKFINYHELQGTRDFSAFLAVPAAIRFMTEHNWEQVSRDCRKLVRDNVPRFAQLLHTHPLSSVSDAFLGQMASFEITSGEPEKLQKHLFDRYDIEIPVMRHGNKCFIRYSINAFNSQEDLDRLYAALSYIKSANTALLEVQD
jgi:isopenicillin-N epimerase